MASPALGSPFNAPLDPTKQGRYTLQLGDGITNRSSPSGFSSIKFNHKPNLSHGTRSSKLSPQDATHSTLKITDNEDGKTSVYKYTGHQSSPKRSYVLIFDQSSQSCTLEPLDSAYSFNIQSTPWEPSASKLAEQYKQLRPKTNEEETDAADDFQDEGSDVEPDPDNPYDYRHYLKATSPSPSPDLRPTSTIKTPNLTSSRPQPAADTKPRSRPAAKTDPLRPAPRKPAKVAQRPTPTVRLDRRASTRPGETEKRGPKLPKGGNKSEVKSDYYVHSSDDEDEPIPSQATAAESLSDVEEDEEITTRRGGLEIDFGASSPPPKRKTKALAISGAFRGGPISLHSAANSPNSRVVTPRHQQKKSRKDEDVIDFGDSSGGYDENEEESDVDEVPADRRKIHHNDVDMHDASDEGGDDDVEPMTLGSPAHQQQAVDEDDFDADADADADADFELEMMQELANGDNPDDASPPEADESEESEAD